MGNRGVSVSGFQPGTEVTNPEELFGHNETGGLLDSLTTHLRLGTNCQLLGERRSGKSSVLRCCEKVLAKTYTGLLPVYLNPRDYHHVAGYYESYRLILASVHQIVAKRTRSSVIFVDGVRFARSATLEDRLETLESVPNGRLESLLEAYLRMLGRRRRGVVLLLDEYEHFIRYTLGGKKGSFFHLRRLSSLAPAGPGSPKPLTYVMAGAEPWDRLCDAIGSPELNNIGAVLAVPPIGVDAFLAMWALCLSGCSPDVADTIRRLGREGGDAFRLSGGWPFYGKVLGQHLSAGSSNEGDYEAALRQHFNVVWVRLSDGERRYLAQAAAGVQLPGDAVVSTLKQRGLLSVGPAGVQCCGELWARFCRVRGSEGLSADRLPTAEVQSGATDELRLLSDEIAVQIAELNEASQLSTGEEMFTSSNQDTMVYADLRRPADNRDQFTHFCLSLYNLIYERTVATKTDADGRERTHTLERLPGRFRRGKPLVRAVATLRHHFGKGHLTSLKTFDVQKGGMPLAEVCQRYLGRNHVPKGEDFIRLQRAVLLDVKKFLTDLSASMAPSAKGSGPD